MELRHLRYFAMVGEELSFRRAAERLHVTRPALSMQIKNLEEELGVRLLERNTSRVALTSAGEVYLRHVQKVLEMVEEAGDRAREIARGRSSRLIIGEVGPLTPVFIPPALRGFRQAFPDVEVTLLQMERELQVAALLADEIHLGFVVGEDLPRREGLLHRRVLHSRIGVALGRHHRWAGRDVLSLSELVAEPIAVVGTDRSSAHYAHLRRVFRNRQLRVPPPLLAGSFDSLLTLIAGDQAISLMPEVFGANRGGEVTIVPIAEDRADLRFDLLAVWRSAEASPWIEPFIRFLEQPEAVS